MALVGTPAGAIGNPVRTGRTGTGCLADFDGLSGVERFISDPGVTGIGARIGCVVAEALNWVVGVVGVGGGGMTVAGRMEAGIVSEVGMVCDVEIEIGIGMRVEG